MRVRGIALFLGLALWVAPTGLYAQDVHDHSAEQTAPEQSKAAMPAMGDMNMMGMMGRMATQHQEMEALMKKLMENMAGIQAEKDPAALKTKLAEQAALLEQMRAKMMQASDMKMMPGMMDGSKKAEPETKPDVHQH